MPPIDTKLEPDTSYIYCDLTDAGDFSALPFDIAFTRVRVAPAHSALDTWHEAETIETGARIKVGPGEVEQAAGDWHVYMRDRAVLPDGQRRVWYGGPIRIGG